MTSQERKGTTFGQLHERDGAFILPNPWDAGTVRLLVGLGFEAVLTARIVCG